MSTSSSVWARTALLAAEYSGANCALRNFAKRRLLIACYHGVVAGEHPRDADYRNTAGAREFARQMEYLARSFTPVSAAEIQAWVENEKSLPKHPVFVTFDDGYRNNLVHAAPILRHYGIPALIHVTTGYVGQTRPLWCEELRLRILHWPRPKLPLPAGEPDLPLPAGEPQRSETTERVRQACKGLPARAAMGYLDRLRETPLPGWSEEKIEELLAFLSWDEVRALRDLGFDIGSHTVGHAMLSRCATADLNRELRESKSDIERETGRECFAVAYPNGGAGDFNAFVLAAVRAAGYKLGFTMVGGWNRRGQHPLALSRVSIPGHAPEAAFRSRLSGLYSLVHHAS